MRHIFHKISVAGKSPHRSDRKPTLVRKDSPDDMPYEGQWQNSASAGDDTGAVAESIVAVDSPDDFE